MLEHTYTLDPLLGLIVPITIGPSFMVQEDRIARGDPIIEKSMYALVSPMDRHTLISSRLQEELYLPPLGIHRTYIPSLPTALRPRFTVVISIDGFQPRSTDAYAIVMPHPVDCIIGRDILSTGTFDYDGPEGTFSLRMPERF